MATYDRNYGHSAADSRLSRPLRLDWSALVGGSLMGWGVLLSAGTVLIYQGALTLGAGFLEKKRIVLGSQSPESLRAPTVAG